VALIKILKTKLILLFNLPSAMKIIQQMT